MDTANEHKAKTPRHTTQKMEDTENNAAVDDVAIVDVSDGAKQPAKHLMEVDLTASRAGESSLTKADVDVQLQSSYMCTLSGFLRILQVFMSVGGLICVTSTSFNGDGYLMTPGAWRFRVYIFTSVVSILTSFLLLITHASTISRMMPIDWLSLDIGICGILTILYLVATAMVGSAYRDYSIKHIIWPDRNVLLAGMILGFICFALYGCHVTTLLLRCRKRGQFRHRSLRLSDRQADIVS